MLTLDLDLSALGVRAKRAAQALALAPTDQKNAALHAIAARLEGDRDTILEANARDVDAARASGVDPLYIRDRMALEKRLAGMAADVRHVASLPDPVGHVFDDRHVEPGLHVQRRRVPLGVLGVIYEARPNVTVDVAALTLKTGNAAILRGGSEVLHSNRALVALVQRALAEAGLPEDALLFIDSPDRRYVGELLRLHTHVDMIVPRGGAGLHDFCRANSTIPVITGGIGICHLYVDASANIDAALPVIHNAKTQRPAVCNALDTLLVHEGVASDVLPRVVAALRPAGVTFKAAPRALAHLNGTEGVEPAGPDDFDTEWYALTLGLEVVNDLDAAIAHIRAHSTQHSDGILTETPEHAARFVDAVDSAAVYVNASTRFTDGSALGLGAEIAVSTQKMHARGPMGLEELTTYKWVVVGTYSVRP